MNIQEAPMEPGYKSLLCYKQAAPMELNQLITDMLRRSTLFIEKRYFRLGSMGAP